VTQLGEAVLPNVSLKLIQLHQLISFTSTATTEAATATATAKHTSPIHFSALIA
jgi:hypothetical protein